MARPGRPTHEQMVRYCRPQIDAGADWETVLNNTLNEWDGLTTSDADYEQIMEVIRAVEREIEEKASNGR